MKDLARAILFVVFTAACLGLDSCAHSPALAPQVYSCASAEGQKVISELEIGVADILVAGDYERALLGLAAALGVNGLDIVNCVVRAYLDKPAPQTQTAIFDLARSHGTLWLAAHSK